MAGPWEKYGGTQQPAVIQGPPRTPPPQTPAQAQKDIVELENARLETIKKREDLARTPDGPPTTEAERTAAFLATRLQNAFTQLNEADPTGESRPSIAAGFAGIFGQTARNLANPADRRRIEAAQLEALDSALTLGTGAAYTREQLDNYRQSYFPQVGDDDFTIADKRERFKALLNAARTKAGAAAPLIDEALAGLDRQGVATSEPGRPRIPLGQGEFGEQRGNPLSAEQQAAYDSFIRANPKATPEQLRGFFGAMGFDVKNADDVIRAREEGLGVQPASQAIDDRARQMAARLNELEGEQGLGALARQGMTGNLSDEAAGVGNSLANIIGAPFTGDFSPIDAYQVGRDADRLRLEEARQRTGALGTVAEILGSAGMLRPGTPIGGSLMRQGAIGGATAGGISGYGRGEGVESLGSGAGGAIVGGLTGGALGALGDRLSRPPTPPGGQDAMDLAQAAQAEGVTVSRPILDDAARDRMAFLEASPGSGGPVRRGLEATRESIEQRAAQLGAGGTAEETGTLGQRIQDAGQRYINRSRTIVGRAYDRAAQMAGGNPVRGQEAVARLDQHIADLAQNPNANRAEIAYLQDLRRDFVDDAGNLIAKDVAAIRDLRTSMRGQISERNLTMSGAERRVNDVLDGARADITRDLGQAAPAAVRAYARADRMHAERMSEIQQVVQRFIGRRDDRLSGEQVAAKLRAMAGPKGDSARLERMVRKLTPDERNDVAATIAETLGRRSPEDEFSPALFVSGVRTLSPQARRLIFGDEGARSITNLRALSEAYRDTVSRLNNSRSGQVANWGQFLKQFSSGGALGAMAGMATGSGAVATGGTGLALGAASAGLGALSRNLSARSLMNPDLTRWLAAAAQQNTPRAIGTHIERLGTIAARNPVIANDVLGLQAQLRQAFGTASPIRRAAAEESENDR